jgi:hypothetical protein
MSHVADHSIPYIDAANFHPARAAVKSGRAWKPASAGFRPVSPPILSDNNVLQIVDQIDGPD